MRKTKIICTLGPSSESYDVLKEMVQAGMSVARFNMAHGSYEDHQRRIDLVKKVRADLGVPLAIMIDIKGPEVRTGTVPKPMKVKLGDKFIFTTRDVVGENNICPVTYPSLHLDVFRGGQVLLNDGLLEMRIDNIKGQDIHCTSFGEGEIKDHKNMHFPGVHLSIPFIRDKDRNDMMFAIKNEVEFIAASFVSRASEVKQVRDFINYNGGGKIDIISKIENKEGVDHIDEILAACEGIMVARGDLGVEIPIEQIPSIQKELIKKTHLSGKRVITATEMLESMTYNPRPTRAEISDVANAVYDGTSAVMLSGETAVGKFPVNVVKTMAKVALFTEKNINYYKLFKELDVDIKTTPDAVSHSSVNAAFDLKAKAIVVCTHSGSTARFVSRYRPSAPIVSMTTREHVYHQLAMSWGAYPILAAEFESLEELIEKAKDSAMKYGFASSNDTVVITAGIVGSAEGTNLMRIEKLK